MPSIALAVRYPLMRRLVYGAVAVLAGFFGHDLLDYATAFIPMQYRDGHNANVALDAIGLIIAVAVYAVLTNRLAGKVEPETRCRRCSYTLRGIREPTCPECGEVI